MMRNDGSASDGFTLIELLVVIAICGILTTLGVMSFRHMAEEGKVESAAQTFRRTVYQARASAMRNDQPRVLAFNTAVPEANLMSYDTLKYRWHEPTFNEQTEWKNKGPSVYSDAPGDQWYAIIGSTIKRDGWNWDTHIGYRPPNAEKNPLDGVDPGKAWVLDLVKKNTGEWDPQDIQIGKRRHLPDGVRFWRRMDFTDWNTNIGTDTLVECIGAKPDAICAARMCASQEIRDKGSPRMNLNVYPRGTFNNGTCATYASRGGRFAHIYTGFVSKQDIDVRRIVTMNPITGLVYTTRDWDLPR